MKQKTSFLLHHDTLSVIEDLTNEQVGELIREIYKTSISLNNPNNPVAPSGLKGLMNSVFHPFKAQLLRDYDKYVGICERNKANGSKSNTPVGPSGGQSVPVGADSDKDSHSDNVNDNDRTLSKNIFDHLMEIYVSITQPQIQELMPFVEKFPDVEKFGRLAKKIHRNTETKFRGKPLWLCQKVFTEYSKEEFNLSESLI